MFSKILINAKKRKQPVKAKKVPNLKYISIAASIKILFSIGWSYQQAPFQTKKIIQL
jgi:hypothetical protein